MAKDTRKKKNQQIKQRTAQEAARRKAQSENAKPKKIMSPEDLIKGFTGDVVELESHARQLEQFLKTRIELIYKLKENAPEKFAALSDAPFKELQDKMQECLSAIRNLFELIGTIVDMEKFADKMTTIHDNFGKFLEAQIQFQGFAFHMQNIDEQFNKQYQSLLTPPVSLDKTADGQEMPMEKEESTDVPEQPAQTDAPEAEAQPVQEVVEQPASSENSEAPAEQQQ